MFDLETYQQSFLSYKELTNSSLLRKDDLRLILQIASEGPRQLKPGYHRLTIPEIHALLAFPLPSPTLPATSLFTFIFQKHLPKIIFFKNRDRFIFLEITMVSLIARRFSCYFGPITNMRLITKSKLF